MPHASAMRRFPVSDATRLVDSDLESGEIPDSDLESDNASDLSSLTVAALGNARSWSLACRMDTEETPQVVVAITHDPCDEESLLTTGGLEGKRARHTAETPQLVVAITPHLGGEDCKPDAAETNAISTLSNELTDVHECAPPPKKKRVLVALSSLERACGPMAGRASLLGAAPVRFHGDELIPAPWREFVHAVRLASARGEYGKFIMDRKYLGLLPGGQGAACS